jgi:glycosyltransferase involved in cell wall biosynthesis
VDPKGGGPIEGVKQLAMANQLFGHSIEVASLDAPNAECLRQFPLPVHALGPGLLKYGYSSRMLPWLRKNARNYDIVVVNGLWQYHGFAVWRALHKSETPYVVFTHGMLDPWFKHTYPLKHLKKLLYWPWAEYRVLRDAGAVLFTCEEERVLARQSFSLYKCNEIVAGYGSGGSDGNPQAGLNELYSRFPELRNKRIAIFMGRIHEKKGCDLLIQSFARELASNPEWHLLICGPDQVGWKAMLVSMAEHLGIANRITWAGMVSGDLKWGALFASEIFVLPSHQENFGIVVAEALACGVPVLISDKVNIWHEVRSDGAGIVSPDTLEGTCALLRTWKNMSDQQKSGMRARTGECFERRFEIHAAAHTLIAALESVCTTSTQRK